MKIRLPFLGDRTYQMYSDWGQRIRDARDYSKDAMVTPDESAALQRYADRVERGLRIRKASDAVMSLNVCAMQVAGTAFLPAMLLGATTVAVGCAATLGGGLLLHLGTTLLSGSQPLKAITSGARAMQDAIVFGRHADTMAERRREQAAAAARIERKVEQFGTVLQKVAQPPVHPPTVVRDEDALRIAGVRVPVRTGADKSVVGKT
jgi:hypothetical protein